MPNKLFGRGRPALEQDGVSSETNGATGEAKRAPRAAPVDARLLKASRPKLVAAPAVEPPVDYAQIGGHVAEVLEAAKAAAEKIRLDAYAEAEQLRTTAEDQARKARETAKATAERADAHAASITADAERQSKEVREQADAYASSRRKTADEEAAAVVARSEKQASVRERRFLERQRALDENVVRTEKRLRQLVAGLHELASGLAELVPPQDHEEGEGGSLVEILSRSATASHSAPQESETT